MALVLTNVLTLVLFLLVSSANSEAIISAQNREYLRSNLGQLADAVARTNESVEKLVIQVYFDASIQKFLFPRPPDDHVLLEGLGQLENYRFISPIVQSIYLYNSATGIVYVSSDFISDRQQAREGFFDPSILDAVRRYGYGRPLVPLPRRIPAGDIQSKRGIAYDGFSFLYFNNMNPDPDGNLLVANVSDRPIRQAMARLDSHFGSTTLILDAAGRLVVGTANDQAAAELGNEPLIRTILDGPPADGYLEGEFRGSASWLAYTGPDKNGWRYLILTPADRMLAGITGFRNTMLLVGLGILLAGFALSLGLAWRLARPISRQFHDLVRVKQENRSVLARLRQDEWRELVLSYSPEGFQRLSRLVAELEGPSQLEGPIQLVLLKLPRPPGPWRHDGGDEAAAAARQAMDTYRQACRGEHAVELVRMSPDRLVAVHFMGDAGDGLFAQRLRGVHDRFVQLQASTGAGPVSLVLSQTGESIAHLSHLYGRVVQDSYRLLFREPGAILQPTEPLLSDSTGYTQARSLEKQILEALRSGNEAHCRRYFERLIEVLSRQPWGVANLAYSHLVFNLTATVEAIGQAQAPRQPLGFNVPGSLSDFASVDEIRGLFHGAFVRICAVLQSRRDHRSSDLVDQVRQLVSQEFANRNLSINWLAEALKLNANYLGRLFRKASGESITDHIMEVRLAHARELLAASRVPIASVSSQVGFTSDGYFYRAFKKRTALTPADYRKRLTMNAAGDEEAVHRPHST